MSDSVAIQVTLTASELRYVVSCGMTLAQNVPESAMPSYCGFTVQQVLEFSARMRNELDRLGLDM